MTQQPPLTPENFELEFNSRLGVRQQGHVKGYSYFFINDPQNVIPITTNTDAMFYLKLDIVPEEGSDIAVLFIRFEPDQKFYPAVRYGNNNGNVTKPVSHYAGIMDQLRLAQTNGRQVKVSLLLMADGRNSLVLQ